MVKWWWFGSFIARPGFINGILAILLCTFVQKPVYNILNTWMIERENVSSHREKNYHNLYPTQSSKLTRFLKEAVLML